jgi:hypothetical protein
MAKKEWKIEPGKDGAYSKTIRFDVDEVERLNAVLGRMQHRPNAQAASLNKAMKELLGVASYGLVTPKDREELSPPGTGLDRNTPRQMGDYDVPSEEEMPEIVESVRELPMITVPLHTATPRRKKKLGSRKSG